VLNDATADLIERPSRQSVSARAYYAVFFFGIGFVLMAICVRSEWREIARSDGNTVK